MSFKDVLVHVDDSERSANRVDLALSVAMAHQAHLVALNVRGRSLTPAMLAAQLSPDIDRILAEEEAEAARRSKARVEGRCRQAGMSVEWRDVPGPVADILAVHSRYADLAIIGQPSPYDMDGPNLADTLILGVGRPVMVVPYAGQFSSIGRRVLVAWNASREATRAVHDAMPILVGAELVHVLVVNPHRGPAGHGDVPGADICLHLSRHGVRAVCEHVRADDMDAGATLLNRVSDEDCDMIVSGAYGRSRLREMVLGGVTRHLLDHMTVPVLFSH